jgi:hypothetical protein
MREIFIRVAGGASLRFVGRVRVLFLRERRTISFAALIPIEALREPVEAINLNLGKALKNLLRQWSPLAHYANDVKRQKLLDKSGWICNVVVKGSDLRRS